MDYIAFALSNFCLSMFAISVIFILLHISLCIKNISLAEIIYRWMSLFALGLTSIYTCIMHVFFPVIAAANIGWQTSYFQLEVGMANFALGVIAILSFRGTYNFRRATVIAAACMLWGDALGHLYQMAAVKDYTIGYADSWLVLDMVVPALLLMCILKLKPARYRHA